MKIVKIISLMSATFAVAILSLLAQDTTNSAATDNSMTDTSATMSATDAPCADPFEPAMSDDDWKFGITAPLWIPQIDGNVTVRGHQENVNISFNTLKDHLDSVFAMAVEAHKGKFSVYGDVNYMKFSASTPGPDGHVTAWAGLKFLTSDLAGAYQLVSLGDTQRFVLEGTVGVRYWYASTPVTFSDEHGTTLFAGSQTWNWVDPVIGLRGSQYFTQKFHLDFQGDGGGFNISHDTDWTWAVTGELTYDFVKWFSLSAGYQALALDQSENKANGANGINFIFNGALVELNFRF